MLYLLLLTRLLVISVYSLDNGLVRTPPMGWMSWTKFYCQTDCIRHPFTCISERLYMEMADRLVEDGYANAGYKYVHIDDCWMTRSRDQNGSLVADPTRFPRGMSYLAKYMHDRGLLFAIYGDVGFKTCEGYPGSYNHFTTDAKTFAEWEVDYLKLDGCNLNIDLLPKGYDEMGKALNATGRPIVYSCSWPAYLIDHPEKVDYAVIGEKCNLWRNFDDISRKWSSVKSIIDYYDHNQDKLIRASGPGRWNDPDMLIVGNTELTVDQSKVQMTIWSIWSAPLIMSNDLRLISPSYKSILLNEKVIAIDQDPLGIMGRLVANTTDIAVYVKPVTPYIESSKDYSYAVAIFNRNLTEAMNATFILSKIGLTNADGYILEDLWSQRNLGLWFPSDQYSASVSPTGIHFIKATLSILI
ncbi:hypothetical protein AB6A40_005878 [Gnathostoma spinigerum]|uniref:Alpha-galactosidase n=1 Tax=Gnathostoma spinigerum TaxID=75299 RepID=A0ABD6EGR8_9BILA